MLDYRRVREYAADHPNHGRAGVGNALDLPPSRVRGWLDGGMPDPDGGVAAALVELLAHVLAGGSVTSRTFVPAVTTGRRVGLEAVRDAFERVGVETVVRRADDENRATEVIPTADGSVLGRCPVTTGAPAGEEVDLDGFPAVVWEVPRAVRESFARIYVDHRGTDYAGKRTMAVHEERSADYLRGSRVAGGRDRTIGDRQQPQVTISAAAVRELRAT